MTHRRTRVRPTAQGALALILFVIAACSAGCATWAADTRPTTACEDAALHTSCVAVTTPPIVQIRKATSVASISDDSLCPGDSNPSSTLVCVRGAFQTEAAEDAILSRFGAISKLALVRYWSTTEHAWRPLVIDAHALTQQTAGRPRTDFTTAELESGRDFYLSQIDNRSAHEVIYRVHLREKQAHRFVIETENVTSVRWWALTLYKPGDLNTRYIIEERSPGIWLYFSLTRIVGPSWLVTGHERSYINRVVALYRHFAGIPTDLEPPPAP